MSRVVFLGTPEAAVPTLERLIGEHDVGLIVTQPDRPQGRSGTPVAPPVKESALAHSLPVAQPDGREALDAAIRDHGPFDVGVVVAFGRILRPEILGYPEHGLLNVHFSLLPRWRGAAPVARALMAGDEMTGVTIMRLDEGLDTGPVLTAQAIDIPEHDDAGRLTKRLAELGASLLSDVLPRYLRGQVEAVPQSDDGATYAAKIEKSERRIDPDATPASVVSKVRALSPEPTATLMIDDELHKIHEVRPSHSEVGEGEWERVDGRPVVGFPGGSVELVTLQPPGRTRQSGVDWANGRQRDRGVIG